MMTDEEKKPHIDALVAERIAALKRGENFACRTGKRTLNVLPCIVCGDPVPQGHAVRPRLMCSACYVLFAAEYKRVYERTFRTVKHGGARHCCRRACKFCGSRVHVGKGGYCRECVAAGLDNVHKVTGRTNGWDAKPKAKPAPVADGWRGRPCAGGGTRNFQQFELSLGRSPSTPLTAQRERDRMMAKARKARYNARQKALKAEAETGNVLPDGQD